jgi:hypothetical protein
MIIPMYKNKNIHTTFSVDMFVTVLFIVFFYHFFRGFILQKSVIGYEIFTSTILLIVWYGVIHIL